MADIKTDESLVFLDGRFPDRWEAIGFLADELFGQGYVKETFKQNVLKREMDYPTGLRGQFCNFSLAHTDCEFVNRSAYAVMVLEETVDFEHMEMEDEAIPVSVVFMLAMDSHECHLEFLQKLAGFMQRKELVESLLQSKSRTEAAKLLLDNL